MERCRLTLLECYLSDNCRRLPITRQRKLGYFGELRLYRVDVRECPASTQRERFCEKADGAKRWVSERGEFWTVRKGKEYAVHTYNY